MDKKINYRGLEKILSSKEMKNVQGRCGPGTCGFECAGSCIAYSTQPGYCSATWFSSGFTCLCIETNNM